jgi:hypothetical protein
VCALLNIVQNDKDLKSFEQKSKYFTNVEPMGAAIPPPAAPPIKMLKHFGIDLATIENI